MREGLKAILAQSDLDAQFIEAWDEASVWHQLSQHTNLDMVLLDIQLPGLSGLELLKRIAKERPQLPIIMLSADHDSDTVSQALQFGATGFLPKSSLNQVLISAIRLVLAGGIYIPPEALLKSASNSAILHASKQHATLESLALTGRQGDVLRLLIRGMSNKLISREIDLAEATVKIHIRGILRSLNVTSRTEALVKLANMGIRLSDNSQAPPQIKRTNS